MTPNWGISLACLLAATLVLPGCATSTPTKPKPVAGPATLPPAPTSTTTASPPPTAATSENAGTDTASGAAIASTSGLAIYRAFRDGLAEPQCGNAQPRWRKHFAHAPKRLGDTGSDTLVLFGYVVDSLRQAGLPTEFALVPFIESGYAPGARSKAGPAGLWQFIAITGRNHGLRIESGYDGRLSPAESTRAAITYLQSLHDRFDGNWRLTAMAYNAGEFRVLQALRRSGVSAADATPADIKGMPAVTYAYVEKLHALACLIEEAGAQPQWRDGLDHPVVKLRAQPLEQARSLDAWAAKNGQDAAQLRRLNPALAGHWPSRGTPLALVPATAPTQVAASSDSNATEAVDVESPTAATHTVRKGDSAWSIAKRYGVSTRHLLEMNGLKNNSVLRPGMVLRVQ